MAFEFDPERLPSSFVELRKDKDVARDPLSIRERLVPTGPRTPPLRIEETERDAELRQNNIKMEVNRAFWNVAGEALPTAGQIVQGFGVGATSMGWEDLLISQGRVRKKAIAEAKARDLEKRLKLAGITDVKRIDEKTWSAVKNEEKIKFDPRQFMVQPNSRAELVAMYSGYGMSPAEQMGYNLGKFFGTFLLPGAAGKRLVSALRLPATTIGKIAQGSGVGASTGMLWETSEQLMERARGKDFSFSEIAKTGALFAVFGAMTESINAIVGARRMTEFIKKHPDLFNKNLTVAENKILLAEANALARLAAAENVRAVQKLQGLAKKKMLSVKEMQFLKNADPLLRQAAHELKPSQMERLLREPYMTRAQIDATVGKKAKAVWAKLDRMTVAERAAESMSKHAVSASGKVAKVTALSKKVKAGAKPADVFGSGSLYHSTVTPKDTVAIAAKGLRKGTHVSSASGQGVEGPITLVFKGEKGIEAVSHRPGDAIAKEGVESDAIEAILYDTEEFVDVRDTKVIAEDMEQRLSELEEEGVTPEQIGSGEVKDGKMAALLDEEKLSLEKYGGKGLEKPHLDYVIEAAEELGVPIFEYNYSNAADARVLTGKMLYDPTKPRADAPQAAAKAEGASALSNPFADLDDAALLSLRKSGLVHPEFLAECDKRGLIKQKWATTQQKKHVVDAARALGISGEQLENAILLETGGNKQALEDLTISEADGLLVTLSNIEDLGIEARKKLLSGESYVVDRNMTTNDHARLYRAAGNDPAVFNNGMLYLKELGGAPDPKADIPDAQGQYEEYVRDAAIVMKKQAEFARKAKIAMDKNQPLSLLNEWQNVVFALEAMEIQTGTPGLARGWRDGVAELRAWDYHIAKDIKEVAQRAGAGVLGKVHDPTSNHLIYHWAHASNEADKADIWRKMSPETQALAVEVDRWWQGEGAVLTRWAEFVRLDRVEREVASEINMMHEYGLKISKAQMKRFKARVDAVRPPNMPVNALNEGRLAKEAGKEEFGIWIESQTWGTRANYAPTKHKVDGMIDEVIGVSMPKQVVRSELARSLGSEPVPGHIRSRLGELGEVRVSDNILLDIHNQATRTAAYIVAQDFLPKFQEKFLATNPSDRDIANAKNMIRAFLGLPGEFPKAAWRIARTVNTSMWRALLTDHAFNTKFALRQAFQNSAFLPSQFPIDQLVAAQARFPQMRALVNFWRMDDVARKEFMDWMVGNISEGRSLKNYMILKSGTLTGLEAKGRVTAMLDMAGFVPAVTDFGNRSIMWPIAYDIAKRNLKLFRERAFVAPDRIKTNLETQPAEMTAKELYRRCGLDNLSTLQSMRLKKLVAEGKDEEFARLLAVYKTENVHGRYHPLMRSVQEMDMIGRLTMGLVPFPRLAANLVVRNAVDQMRYGDPKRFRRGLESLIKLFAFTSGASYAYYMATRQDAYDMFNTTFGWGPGGIGVQQIMELKKEFDAKVYQAEQTGEPPEETALKILKVGEKNLELVLPFAKTILREYEIRTDKDHQHLHNVAQALYDAARGRYKLQTGKSWSYRDRTWQEKMRYRMFGTDRAPKKSEWDLDGLFNRSEKRFKSF